MEELKKAIREISGVGCVGKCEKEAIGCSVGCSIYGDCLVITDFFARLDEAELNADKVLAGLGEIDDEDGRRSLIASYGIICGMK